MLSNECYQNLMSKMSDDGVDVDSIVMLYNSLLFNLRQFDSDAIWEVFADGEIVRHQSKCWFRDPDYEERLKIINLYVDIEPYRSFIFQTSDYGPYSSEYDYIIRSRSPQAMHSDDAAALHIACANYSACCG